MAAFMAGLCGINSIVIFILLLLIGWGVNRWIAMANIGLFYPSAFTAMMVLNSSSPYTTAVEMSLLITIAFGLAWLVDRLFWPVFGKEGIEQQISATFKIFRDMSDCAFYNIELSEGYVDRLAARADASLRATRKALKTAAMSSGLSPFERDNWEQAIALQERLLTHLVAISRLLQDNRENPLLQELASELSALGNSLSATFARLSIATVDQQYKIQLSSPNIDFQNWQTRLTSIRRAGMTFSFDLADRLKVGLIEYGLEGLINDISESLVWLEAHRSDVPADLPIVLKPAR